MSKHSKSPWIWAVHQSHGDNSAVMESLIDADGKEVLWIGDCARHDSRCGYEPDQADKNLIAEAPDLLAALIVITDKYAAEMESEYCATESDLPEVLAARATIARARGEV